MIFHCTPILHATSLCILLFEDYFWNVISEIDWLHHIQEPTTAYELIHAQTVHIKCIRYSPAVIVELTGHSISSASLYLCCVSLFHQCGHIQPARGKETCNYIV